MKCADNLSLVNYHNAFIYSFFEKDKVTWAFFGPSWVKEERNINDEEKIFSQMLNSLRFED